MARLLASPFALALLGLLLAFAAAPRGTEARFLWGRPPTTAEAATEMGKLVTFLNGNGYSSLVSALTSANLVGPLQAALEKNKRLTILAPTNAAFAAFQYTPGAACEPSLAYILRTHVLPVRLPAIAVKILPNDLLPVATFSPVAVWKTDGSPLTISVRNGPFAVLTSAQVTAPDAYVSKYIVVHGINTVLDYPAGTTCT